MKIVGIDPGIDGAICFMKDNSIKAVIKMPTTEYTVGSGKKQKKKKMVDSRLIGELLRHFNPNVVFVEKVGAMPGQGVVSMFSFGMSTGILHGICGALQIDVIEVRPQTWKSIILDGTNKDKEAAIGFCKYNFPETDLLPTKRSKKPHDGMADSICIACYGIYNMKNNINTEDGEEDESDI